ncbi:MAG: hypothetical protein FWG74_06085 [Planctomycetes bacterium]|nr:hypothetical protein [Planctomycetota bacterium]
MEEKALLLGAEEESARNLAGILAGLGLQLLAVPLAGFSPRALGRDRPRLILADADRSAAGFLDRLVRDIRKYWGARPPVLALSASRKFSDVSAILDAGVDDCLSKGAPADLAERKLHRWIAKNSPAAGIDQDDELPDRLLSLFTGGPDLIRLGDLATVHSGVSPRRSSWRRLAPPDSNWRGVLTADAVDRFFVGKPNSYLRWSRFHLFRLPPPEEYAVSEKVLLRRSGPPLAAAIDRSRLPAGTDVYSLVPMEGVGAGFVACLLNSRLLDFYFNRIARLGPAGRLRPEDIRGVPVPRPTPEAARELTRIATLLTHFGPNPQNWIDRQSKDELLERMENAVFDLYQADREVDEELASLYF